MSSVAVSVSDIVDDALLLARRHRGLLAAVGAAIAVGYTALDMLGASGLTAVLNIFVVIWLQYYVLEQLLLDRIGPEQRGNRRYLSLLGSGILAGLGILLGVILLVVPGLYLAGRWLASAAFVVAEGKSASESLQASWNSSEKSKAAHVVVALLAALPLIGLIVLGYLAFAADFDIETLTGSVILNLLTAASSLFSWVLGAAAYRVSNPTNALLEQVFD
jgi:hypothetical protein